MPSIPAFGRQVDLCEFEDRLVYVESSRTVRRGKKKEEPLCTEAGGSIVSMKPT